MEMIAPIASARKIIGIAMALISRLVLLAFIGVIISLDQDLIVIGQLHLTPKDLILLAGGLAGSGEKKRLD